MNRLPLWRQAISTRECGIEKCVGATRLNGVMFLQSAEGCPRITNGWY
jgi:hypothetical protein